MNSITYSIFNPIIYLFDHFEVARSLYRLTLSWTIIF